MLSHRQLGPLRAQVNPTAIPVLTGLHSQTSMHNAGICNDQRAHASMQIASAPFPWQSQTFVSVARLRLVQRRLETASCHLDFKSTSLETGIMHYSISTVASTDTGRRTLASLEHTDHFLLFGTSNHTSGTVNSSSPATKFHIRAGTRQTSGALLLSSSPITCLRADEPRRMSM